MTRLRIAVLGIVAATLAGQIPAMAAPNYSNGEGGQCRVVIDRSKEPGTFDVTRQTSNEECVCYAYTGPETQDQATENRVANLLARKSCPDAKTMALAGRCSASAGGCAGAGPLGLFGGGAAGPLVVGASVAAIGVAAAASGKVESPTSP